MPCYVQEFPTFLGVCGVYVCIRVLVSRSNTAVDDVSQEDYTVVTWRCSALGRCAVFFKSVTSPGFKPFLVRRVLMMPKADVFSVFKQIQTSRPYRDVSRICHNRQTRHRPASAASLGRCLWRHHPTSQDRIFPRKSAIF